MSRMRIFVAGALTATALLLSGCAGQSSGTAPAKVGTAGGNPVHLVGIWKVAGAEGEGEDTWLKLGAGEVVLWRECTVVFGGIKATEALLLVGFDGTHVEDGCAAWDGESRAPWLTGPHTHQQTEDGWELLDRDGAVVASLTKDGPPPDMPGLYSQVLREPEVTPEVEALFEPSVPLPQGLSPVSDLLGRWVPVDQGTAAEQNDDVHEEPFIEFAADGTWQGSDGCNGQGGRWADGGEGQLLATTQMSTEMGCDGANVGGWLFAVALAGTSDGRLVLLDRAGAELGRLVRG